jgi:hypothetical protein
MFVSFSQGTIGPMACWAVCRREQVCGNPGWGRGGNAKDEGGRMNQETWCICFSVFIEKVTLRIPDSNFILSEWGRVDI